MEQVIWNNKSLKVSFKLTFTSLHTSPQQFNEEQ